MSKEEQSKTTTEEQAQTEKETGTAQEEQMQDQAEDTATQGQENAAENKEEQAGAQQQEEAQEEQAVEEDPLVKLQQELGEAKDKYMRLYAEFDNYRRRTAKERLTLVETASGDLMKEILPVVDDFQRAAENADKVEDKEALAKGYELIRHKLGTILEKKGLKPMDCKGEAFDADTMEAVTHIPAGEEMSGKVVDEIEKGYYLGEKIIRYAKVVVGQ